MTQPAAEPQPPAVPPVESAPPPGAIISEERPPLEDFVCFPPALRFINFAKLAHASQDVMACRDAILRYRPADHFADFHLQQPFDAAADLANSDVPGWPQEAYEAPPTRSSTTTTTPSSARTGSEMTHTTTGRSATHSDTSRGGSVTRRAMRGLTNTRSDVSASPRNSQKHSRSCRGRRSPRLTCSTRSSARTSRRTQESGTSTCRNSESQSCPHLRLLNKHTTTGEQRMSNRKSVFPSHPPKCHGVNIQKIHQQSVEVSRLTRAL
jgi:hypothetical protein